MTCTVNIFFSFSTAKGGCYPQQLQWLFYRVIIFNSDYVTSFMNPINELFFFYCFCFFVFFFFSIRRIAVFPFLSHVQLVCLPNLAAETVSRLRHSKALFPLAVMCTATERVREGYRASCTQLNYPAIFSYLLYIPIVSLLISSLIASGVAEII